MTFPLPGRILPLAPGTFRALRHRDFRLLWIGQLVSLVGTWMQSVAQGWLVLRLSDSVFQLGLVAFFAYLPVLLLSLVGGMAADRVGRRQALVRTNAASMLLAAALAVLTWGDWIRVWHVAVLAFCFGAVTAFDIPIRQSFLQDLVGREDLANAIALNSMAFNSARLVGPAVAGLLVAWKGEVVCFALNAASYLAVVAVLGVMGRHEVARQENGGWVSGVREGLAYGWRTPRVRVILALVAVSSIFGMPYAVLMPAFARDVLGVGSAGLGTLLGATGAGAIGGALYLAGRRTMRHAGRIVCLAMACFGASLVAFSMARSFAAALAFLLLVGGSMIVQMATSNTYLQLVAPGEMRGRMVSLYTLCFIGMTPFGSLLAGTTATLMGTRGAVALGGAVCMVAAVWFALQVPKLAEVSGTG